MTTSDRIRHKWLLERTLRSYCAARHPAIADKLDLDTYLSTTAYSGLFPALGSQPDRYRTQPAAGLADRYFCAARHIIAAIMVVSKTDMLLTLPERHAQLLNTGFGNKGQMNQTHLFPLHAPRLEAHLYWHESVENDPANRWLREEIERVLAPEPRASNKPTGDRHRHSQEA